MTKKYCYTCRYYSGGFGPKCHNPMFREFDRVSGNHPPSVFNAIEKCNLDSWEKRKSIFGWLLNLFKL